MFLFVIGLEMRPVKLWAMRGQIFGTFHHRRWKRLRQTFGVATVNAYPSRCRETTCPALIDRLHTNPAPEPLGTGRAPAKQSGEAG